MKNPRQVLFDKHRAAMPALDGVRRKVIDEELRQTARRDSETRQTSLLGALVWKLWSELILPYRRTWAGLAAVWMVILALGALSMLDNAPVYAEAKPVSPQQYAAFRQQRQELAEMVELNPTEPAEPPPRQPGPKSELKPNCMIG